jgi:type VI secretion system protein ImpA
MPSAPLLEFAALLNAIPGDDPAGSSLPFQIRQKLEEGRKEGAVDENDPGAMPKKPEWKEVTRVAQEALTNTSKDLLVAARLTEALVKQHGFAGLRDGLHLMRELVAQAWDRLYPPIEDNDVEVRASPFNWLDDPDRGARFPNSVRQIPLVFGEKGPLGWLEWRRMMDGKGDLSQEDFAKAVESTKPETCQIIADDAAQCLEELSALTEDLSKKMGSLAPGMTALRQAVQEALTLEKQVVDRKRASAPVADEAAPAPDADGAAAEGAPTTPRAPGGPPASRADAYRQLANAANVLQRLEPHSPIPYLIQRAVQLGSLPFPQLIKELVRDANILRELNRELGIKDEEAPAAI